MHTSPPLPGSGLQFPKPRSTVRAFAGRPPLRVFNDTDGLPQNDVQTLILDTRGYLWVGTQGGAARFNGREWTLVPMPDRVGSNFVYAILEASDGSLWFGTNGGGVVRRKHGRWSHFDSLSGALPSNQVRCLLETVSPDGTSTIWVGTRNGLARLRRGLWTSFGTASGLPDPAVLCLLEPSRRQGVLWVGTRGGLARHERGEWTTVDTSSGLPDNVITCMLETQNPAAEGTLWVGTYGGGLARLHRRRWSVFDRASGLPHSTVFSLAETSAPDGTRALWVGTGGRGLACLEQGSWSSIDKASGMPSDVVYCFAKQETAGGTSTLWAGTLGGGLARLELGLWTAYEANAGLPDAGVFSILEVESSPGERSLCVGTRAGLACLERGAWSTYDTTTGLPNNVILCMADAVDAGGARALWVGTRGGLARLGAGQWVAHTTSNGLPHDVVFCLLQTVDPDGTPSLWAGTGGGGLACLRAGDWTTYDTSSGLPSDFVMSLLETVDPDGTPTLWVGTVGGGLARLRDGRWTVEDTTTGLPGNSVYSLLETKGPKGIRTLWVGTEAGGVGRRRLDDDGPWTVLSDRTAPALPDNTVYQLREDALGRVYVFTNRGVARLTPRRPTAADPSSFEVHTFTPEDGLPSNECNGGASYLDARGRVWAGTVGGAAVFDPSREVRDTAPKPLVVERILVNGAERRAPLAEPLAHDENNLAFEYALLSYFRARETRYRTQLVGFDETPSEWTPESKRTYTNLRDGRYRFAVWARDWAGVVAGPVDVEFEVRPAPWRTWWAYSLYGGALACATYTGMRLRLKALERRNEQLEALIAERTLALQRSVQQHTKSEQEALAAKEEAVEANRAKSVFLSTMSHELRTPLNAVLGFARLMDRDRERTAEDREHLATIMRSGEHLLGLINDVLSIAKIEAGKITLVEGAFDLRRLLTGIEEMIRVRSDEKGVGLEVSIEPDVPAAVWGDEGKLRQVLINLLGNAVKFTDEGGVTLRVGWRDGVASFEVEDTGYGISETEIRRLFEPFEQTESGRASGEGTGLGLAISRTFVRLMGGDLVAQSALGVGTVLRFAVPLATSDHGDLAGDDRRVIAVAPGQPAFRLLVADDRPENASMLAKLLELVGFQTRVVGDGLSAVEVWRAWRPHLVWMDMRMPVLDGCEATRRIRALEREAGSLAPRTVIIALTASALEHEREAVLEAGCDDFVAKPFRESTIFETLDRSLGVRFVYERPPGGRSAGAASGARDLPEPWRDDLRRACTIGDDLAAHRIVDAVAERYPELAGELRRLVKNIQFDEILDLIGGEGL